MNVFQVKQKLMGTTFTLGVVAENQAWANEMLALGTQEIKRIENLLSEFLPHSETSKINQEAAVKPIRVSPECYDLLTRCQAISELSKGDFDISVGPLKKIYQFKNKQFTFPSNTKIQEVLACVGYQKIELNKTSRSVRFLHPQTKISFAAIGKGYASDQVKKLWLQQGVRSGYINASGDLNAFGNKEDGSPWNIGIANPDQPENMLLYVPVSNASVATSGDYEQHFIYQQQRYAHTLNPHTGKPVSGIKSVTIFSPGAELSDALATAVFVKGIEKGITFINQLPQTHAILLDDKNKLYFSNKLNYEKALV